MIATTEGGHVDLFDMHWYFDFFITVCGNEEFYLTNTTEINWKLNITEDGEFVIPQAEQFGWYMMTDDGEENWTCNDFNNYEVRNADCLTPLSSENIHINQNGDIVIQTS